MANTFKSAGTSAIGTTKTAVYTAPASTTTTVIGMSLANILGGSTTVTVDVVLTKSAVDYTIVKGAPIPPGGSLVVIGGDQKVVVETGNAIKVTASSNASIDSIVSVLEIT